MTPEELQRLQVLEDFMAKFVKSDRFIFEKDAQFADGRNCIFGRTTGTTLGTDTDQKVGFYGKAGVIQNGTIADASGGATVDSQARSAINSVLAALRNLGIIAT